MGGGCLTPKPRTGEIYIDCINQIYEEVKSMEALDTQNIYDRIKDKIAKKGWLRKLMDYLTSHRASISEAALHTYRLTVQNKGIQYKVTGLVIIDYIFNSIIRENRLPEATEVQKLREKDINAESVYELSEKEPSSKLSPNSNARLFQKKSIPFLTEIDHQTEEAPKNITESSTTLNPNRQKSSVITASNFAQKNANSYSLMVRQVYNGNFCNIFFNMIHTLIPEDVIYGHTLQTVIKYSLYNNVRNPSQEKLSEILQVILDHILTDDQLLLSLEAYYLLIQKLSEHFMEKECLHFKKFFKIWDGGRTISPLLNHSNGGFRGHRRKSTAPLSQKSISQNKIPEKDGLEETGIFLKLQTNESNREAQEWIENIIKTMISHLIGSPSIQKIYEQILAVYDSTGFSTMGNMEELLVSVTHKEDLRNQFLRGLFSFLLNYFSVCRTQSSEPPQKWLSLCILKSYEHYVSQYQNILSFNTKQNVISTIKNWIEVYGFVQISEILKYNCSLFLNSFLINIEFCGVADQRQQKSAISSTTSVSRIPSKESHMHHQHQESQKYIADQLLGMCREANLSERVNVCNELYEEIKCCSDFQKVLYMNLIDNLLYEGTIETQSYKQTLNLCQCQPQYEASVNVSLIQHTTDLIAKLSLKMVSYEIDQISYFLYSVYDLIFKAEFQKCGQFIEISVVVFELIEKVERVSGTLILLAWCERMIKTMTSQVEKFNFFFCWNLILKTALVLYQSKRLLKTTQKKDKQTIMHKFAQTQQLKQKFSKLGVLAFEEEVEKILVENFAEFMNQSQDEDFSGNEESIIQITLPSKQDFENAGTQKMYEISSIAFRDIFRKGVSIVKGGFLSQNQQQEENQEKVPSLSSTNAFMRRNSIIEGNEAEAEEKSLADVVDMIKF